MRGLRWRCAGLLPSNWPRARPRPRSGSFFVERYGDWILYEPPARGLTLWVWLSPLIGLGLLGYGLWRYLARVRARVQAPMADVSDEEIARLEAELQTPERKS